MSNNELFEVIKQRISNETPFILKFIDKTDVVISSILCNDIMVYKNSFDIMINVVTSNQSEEEICHYRLIIISRIYSFKLADHRKFKLIKR